ncbi:DUF6428 family protein [Flavobacteriaceae bacterium]|nr:DUF6428 family protein [Flavobacteriaceae bacterium]MDB2672953.1 DUF6428 family protein [Flavobacteriaceae bacterium]MDB4187593.1 DUF6428 family protein [Flavobacteriaceae bacterium]
MLLSEFLFALNQVNAFRFQLPNGAFVPPHFHITEVGMVHKHFIDCGGTERKESVVNFQLWSSDDVDHRLQPSKVIDIVRLSQQKIGISDEVIEVEYQGETIGKFSLAFDGTNFQLLSKATDCLAKDNCGIPESNDTSVKPAAAESCCDPAAGCC